LTLNANGTFTYTPPANFDGHVSFIYEACDNAQPEPACSAERTVTIDVTPVNDAPVANGDHAATNEDTPVDMNVLSNDTDPDGDALTVASFTQPNNGMVTLNANGTLKYTPRADFNGTDSFAYRARDNSGALSNVATVGITVAPVNGPSRADLSMNKSAPRAVTEDNNFTYILTVRNNGPDAAKRVVVKDTLPAGTSFVSASDSCGFEHTTHTVTCRLVDISDGATETVKVVVGADWDGMLRNRATVFGGIRDPNGANNSDTVVTTVCKETSRATGGRTSSRAPSASMFCAARGAMT
jgi:uncharacterized repeat protein (TIGR01451 family)